MKTKREPIIILTIALFLPSVPVFGETYAGDVGDPKDSTFGKKEYSPYLDIGYPQNVFWGDTHVHTAYSTDAGMVGNTLGPDEASFCPGRDGCLQ